MAEKKSVSEGSVADFIKNFRKMYDAFQNHYELTKDESDALNREHIAQATKNMLSTATGLGSAVSAGTFPAAAIASGAALTPGTGLSLDLLNAIRKGMSEKVPYNPEASGAVLNLSNTRDEEGNDLVPKELQDLSIAKRKLLRNGDIMAPGTFNEQLNSSFLTNLRKNRK